MAKTTWNHGDRTEIARKAGIKSAYFGDIIHARKAASPELAKRLTEAAQSLGYDLERMDFLYPSESLSPLITATAKA